MTHKPESGETRTLVVDDHAISGRHIVSVLSQCPGQVRRAGSASEALKLTFSWYPQIICMDLHLPDIGGVAVIRKIRANWPVDRPAPRIVVLTGDAKAIDREDVTSLHVDHVLVKPITGRQLRQVIGHPDTSGSGKPETGEDRSEMQALFRAELDQRLPELDKSLSLLDRRAVAGILHQLIASAAMTRETRLESSLRSLDTLCRQGGSPIAMARSYHELLESVRGVIFKQSR